jgi:hypothetical protein
MNYNPFILIAILKLKYTSYEIYNIKYNKIIVSKIKNSIYIKNNYNKEILYLIKE